MSDSTPTATLPTVTGDKHKSGIFQRICNILSILSFIGFIALYFGTREALQSMTNQFATAFDAANGKSAGAPTINIEFNPFSGMLDGLGSLLSSPTFYLVAIIIGLLTYVIFSRKKTPTS